MSIKGSPQARLRRALATGNPLLVRTAAAELPRVGLPDALSICLVFLRAEPASYGRAAARFHGRLALECGVIDLDTSGRLLDTLQELRAAEPAPAAGALIELAERLELPDLGARVNAWLAA